MATDWKQYQEEAAAFFRFLGFKAEVNHTVEGVRSTHAIDVYITFDRWGMRHTWIVDCKTPCARDYKGGRRDSEEHRLRNRC